MWFTTIITIIVLISSIIIFSIVYFIDCSSVVAFTFTLILVYIVIITMRIMWFMIVIIVIICIIIIWLFTTMRIRVCPIFMAMHRFAYPIIYTSLFFIPIFTRSILKLWIFITSIHYLTYIFIITIIITIHVK